MSALLWFATGCAGGLLTGRWWWRRQPASTVAAPVTLVLGDTRSIETVARDVAGELANLASSIEGHAQLLCETLAANDERGSSLGTAVRRLHYCSDKLLAFSCRPQPTSRAVDITHVLQAVASEMQHEADGRRVEIRLAPALPRVCIEPELLRNAVLYLRDAVLDLEPDAAIIGLRASPHLDEEPAPCVLIELQAEQGDSEPCTSDPTEAVNLSLLAAARLLAGAEPSLRHWPGQRANACVALDIAPDGDDAVAPAAELAPAHAFGGVLVLSSDPSLRSMLSQELGSGGRHVIPCTDCSSASTLFEATPERFEFLVLDADARPDAVAALARLAIAHEPWLKVLLLHSRHTKAPEIADDRCAHLLKPFCIMGLRESMSALRGAVASVNGRP